MLLESPFRAGGQLHAATGSLQSLGAGRRCLCLPRNVSHNRDIVDASNHAERQ